MNSMVRKLSTAAQKRAAYRRTVSELRSLPIETALDLDIYSGDIRKIAHKAVYGA